MPSLEIIEAYEDDAETDPSLLSSPPQPPSKSSTVAVAKVSSKKTKKKKDEKEMKQSSTVVMDASSKKSRQMTLSSFFGAGTAANQTSKPTKAKETADAAPAVAPQRRKQLRDIVMGVFPKSSVVEKEEESCANDETQTSPTAPEISSSLSTIPSRKRPCLSQKTKSLSSSTTRISLSPTPTSTLSSAKDDASNMKVNEKHTNRSKKRIAISPTTEPPPRQKRIRWSDDASSSDRGVVPSDIAAVDVAMETASNGEDAVLAQVESQEPVTADTAVEMANAEHPDSTDAATSDIPPINPTPTPSVTGVSDTPDPPTGLEADVAVTATPETTAELLQIQSWRTTYHRRVRDLLESCHQGLPEEQPALSLEPLPPLVAVAESTTTFPDSAILSLASIIEGQSLPLPELAALATKVLNEASASYAHTAPDLNNAMATKMTFAESLVQAKIQLLAMRKHFLKTVGAATDKLLDDATAALLQDARMYRWEVVVPSAESYAAFFPNATNRATVKKARTARKKISAYLTALLKALSVLQEAEQALMSSSNDNDDSKKKKNPPTEKILARVHTEVEKLVKFEREQEAHRLAEVARLEKLEADRRQKEQALQQKQAVAAARQKEKELKQQQLAESKEAAQKAKEAAQKAKEAAQKAKETTRSVEPKEKAKPNLKQKQCMMSFLSKAVSNAAQPDELVSSPPPRRRSDAMDLETTGPGSHRDAVSSSPAFDVAAFRSALAGPIPPALTGTPWSHHAPRRRRRTPRVTVPVFVTMYPEGYQQDNPFAAQPYAEQVRVSVPNKYKFLSFYEDVRPPYYGTWSKRSRFISGRRPFRTDPEQLEYDVDSEGEWEEGDDEVGEELGDDGMDEEEKEFEDEDDDEEDGWLAADDEVDDEENDELDDGIKKLPKKKVGISSKRDTLSVCIVAPCLGQPLSRMGLEKNGNSHCLWEGLNEQEALDCLDSFGTICVDEAPIHLQAFPPALVDELDPTSEAPVEKLQVMTEENMKIFASFVHKCSLGSKDKLIDEFMIAHANVNCSRALTLRTLDSIAEKRKHPCNGTFFWEVKGSVLESLGLTKLAESTAMEVENVKQEAMKTIVRFVHNNRAASKEKMVDDLRACHESVTASRAEALRIIQSIAVKQKHPNGGCSWIVKDEVRSELGLSLESPNPTALLPNETTLLDASNCCSMGKDR